MDYENKYLELKKELDGGASLSTLNPDVNIHIKNYNSLYGSFIFNYSVH